MELQGVTVMNFLGNYKGRMNKSRNSLDTLSEYKNRPRNNSKRKPRGKGRRRFSSLKSLLPKDRG